MSAYLGTMEQFLALQQELMARAHDGQLDRPTTEARGIVAHVCAALTAAHARKIVFSGFFRAGVAGMESYFTFYPWLFMFIVPPAGMRAMSVPSLWRAMNEPSGWRSG